MFREDSGVGGASRRLRVKPAIWLARAFNYSDDMVFALLCVVRFYHASLCTPQKTDKVHKHSRQIDNGKKGFKIIHPFQECSVGWWGHSLETHSLVIFSNRKRFLDHLRKESAKGLRSTHGSDRTINYC